MTFKIYPSGLPQTVTVDTLLPKSMISNEPMGVYHTSPQGEWVSILEKAYAKCLGSYSSINDKSIQEVVNDLTGMPVS